MDTKRLGQLMVKDYDSLLRGEITLEQYRRLDPNNKERNLTVKTWDYVMNFGRQTGKTTILIEACKKTGGTLVCMNASVAKRIAREHGITTCSINDSDFMRGRGFDVPFFFEPEAAALEFSRLASLLEQSLERETALKEQLEDMVQKLDNIRQEASLHG